MTPILEETVYLDFVTSSSTGAAADADSTPTAEVFENDTDTTVTALTVTKRTGKTGNYRVAVPCTAANGFEAGKSYNVVASATVGGVAAKATVGAFQVRAAALTASDVWAAGTRTLTGTQAFDLTGNITGSLSGSVGSVTGAVGSVTGNVGGNVAGSVGSVTGNVGGNVAGSVNSVTSAVTVTGDAATAGTRFLTMIELDGSVYRYTVNSLEQAPAGGGGGTTDWTADERDAIRSILGIPGSGTTPADPTTGILDTIRDSVATRASQATADAIVADTNELQTDWANGGRLDVILDARASQASVDTIDGIVDSILADTGTDGVVLSSSTLNAIADALLDRAAGVETNRTPRQALRIILAAAAGEVSGAGTGTVTIRDTNDTVNRIVATTDSSGNRSAVTLNAS